MLSQTGTSRASKVIRRWADHISLRCRRARTTERQGASDWTALQSSTTLEAGSCKASWSPLVSWCAQGGKGTSASRSWACRRNQRNRLSPSRPSRCHSLAKGSSLASASDLLAPAEKKKQKSQSASNRTAHGEKEQSTAMSNGNNNEPTNEQQVLWLTSSPGLSLPPGSLK